MRFLLTSISIFVFSFIGYSQTTDSLKVQQNKVLFNINDRFALARPFNIRYTTSTPAPYQINDLGLANKGKLDNFSQLQFSSNLIFVKKQRWMFGGTLLYRYNMFTNQYPTAYVPQSSQKFSDFHYHTSALNFTYFSKLFNKTAIYTASVAVDGSDKHFERLRGYVTGSLLLKSDAKTKKAIGLIGIIDPSSQVPIFPMFSYERKFDNQYVLDLFLPQRVLLKKMIKNHSRISIGTELDRNSFYFYEANKQYEFRQIQLDNGITFEHLVLNELILSFKTGLRVFANDRVFEIDKKVNDYSYSLKTDPNFYFSLGISYNPFYKRMVQSMKK